MHIVYNAYNIFGLSVDSDDRAINKRYKELTNLVKIGEIPSYSCDIEGLEYATVRTEENINTAYTKLTNLSKKLKEQFFWFELDEDVSVLVLPHILTRGLPEAEMHYKKSQDQTEVKNAILEKLLKLEVKGQIKKNIKHSVQYSGLMKEIKNLLENEKFWIQFTKIRSLFAGVEIRDDLIVSLRNSLPQIFAEHFFDLSENISDSMLYTSFIKVFNIHAKDLDDNKNIQKLHKAIEQGLAKLKSYTESIHTVRTIFSTLDGLKASFSELDQIGLKGNIFYDNTMEKCVSLGRDISLFLHNKHDKTGDALIISKKLLEFDMSAAQRHQIEDDKEKLQNLSSGENYKYKPNWTTPGDSEESESNAGTHSNPHGKPIKSGPIMYTLNGCGTKLYGDTLYFVLLFIPIFPIFRYSVENLGEGQYRFFGKLKLQPWKKIWLVIFLCFVAQAFITSSNASSSNYSSTSSSSYTSPTVTSEATDDDEVIIGQYSCTSYHSDQAGKLSPSTYEKNRLDTEEAELTRLNNEIDNTSVDEYSEYSVNSYNQKIRNYKTKLQEFNDEIVDYNSSVEIYNNYLTTNCKKRY